MIFAKCVLYLPSSLFKDEECQKITLFHNSQNHLSEVHGYSIAQLSKYFSKSISDQLIKVL